MAVDLPVFPKDAGSLYSVTTILGGQKKAVFFMR